jgi:hypothetical protein
MPVGGYDNAAAVRPLHLVDHRLSRGVANTFIASGPGRELTKPTDVIDQVKANPRALANAEEALNKRTKLYAPVVDHVVAMSVTETVAWF